MQAVDATRELQAQVAQSPFDFPILLTPVQVAELLQIKIARIYELVRARRVRAIRVGRQLRFRMSDVESFVEKSATDRW